jgi:hypothetical protein
VVAFVEGNDMSMIRNLAKTLGAHSFVTEANMAIVPLEGAANTQRLVSFRWVAENLLQGTVAGYVLLDRDYRSDEAVDTLRSQLTDSGLTPHVWARKELENYLLHRAAIARLSGAPEGAVRQMLDEISDGMQNAVAFRMTTSRYEDRADRRLSFASVGAACELEVRNRWTDPEERLWACPGKDVISELNKRLQAAHFKAVSAKALSRALLPEEIPSELSAALLTIHRACLGRPRRSLRGRTGTEPASPAVDYLKRQLVGAARKPR